MGNEPEGQRATSSAPGNPLARVTRLTGSGMRALFSTEGVRGTAMEAAWITTHLAMYPLGLVRESTLRGVERHRLDHLPPEQRGLLAGDIEAAGTPIVLVHGLVDNRS
ncbi:MAG: lipase, partial [Actinobacteria bacterium]|nr:lipase [Actinomycetota bacterium]